jgi:hypothetical protein
MSSTPLSAISPLYPDHCRSRELVASGALPPEFNDIAFVNLLADALRQSLSAVAEEGREGQGEPYQGLIIRRSKDGNYKLDSSIPSSEVRNGNRQTFSSFAGAQEQITDATAIVIATPSWQRDNAIVERDGPLYRWLAKSRRSIVVVRSIRSKTWVFLPDASFTDYPWRCP